MNYHAVGDRCAVDFTDLYPPISQVQAKALLELEGFRLVEVDLVSLARERVGTSRYRRGARISEAPEIVDCSSLTKWLYAQRGIRLPRRSIQQREYGETIDWDDIQAEDLVFCSGWINYYFDDPSDGVGHVGMATGEGTIIHAANSRVGVVESSLMNFMRKNELRGIRRYISKDHAVVTIETPREREVECSDDIRWIILQLLGRKMSRTQ